MKCCGHEITTAFCPDCGKPIGGDLLTEIITHVKVLLKATEGAKARSIQWDHDHPDRVNDYSSIRRKASRERKIAKFQRWVNCLETLAREKGSE